VPKDLIAASLPNFPDEVVTDWLVPYALTEGWPPASDDNATPQGRWRYLLAKRSLTTLRSIEWRRETRILDFSELTDGHQQLVVEMVLAAVRGDRNLYSDSIPNLKERFSRILQHIKETGLLPGCPTLISDGTRLSAVDGNHRLAAYFYAFGIFKLPLDDDASMALKEAQPFWIGRLPAA
jgi:hypothetical protein